ncbi:hypothetical protein J31TS4_02120 [Paenibacillus sp. J31TS4]|uniref:endonuclease/exonuclease/phosphatase family protein n=1 Tax=Paenibacillus sp. J31TS4 TaxID=2807195 RepID=UPI001B2F097B|nr:endonuclease/exonuclease/phosphatase family protein [Paenibacillus sp. J31TS4]GIP36932.1 hypothetical protein J31TS4_02120 [Paenibacillus sp. J31TS4]
MKVLQYNVLDGLESEERLAVFDAWFSQQNYDVVGFNELNGWDQERFKTAGEKWGYPYACLYDMKSSPYLIGIMSKTPIQLVHCEEEDFHHGLLHVIIQDIHFLVTHFSPHDSLVREKEATLIARQVSEIDAPVMLMGDLNTLSSFDHQHYRNIGLAEYLRTKSGRGSHHLHHGVLNYRPMHILLAAGLHDIGLDSGFLPTIPTLLLHPPTHFPKLRIDYMLVNDKLLQRSPKSTVIHDEQVEKLSDHYPIECVWTD